MTDDKKAILAHAYGRLKAKFLHQRNLADCLCAGIIGGHWRDHLHDLVPVRKNLVLISNKRHLFELAHITPEMYDWSFNRIDHRAFLGWSVYHLSWEWLTLPDEYGYGAFNLAWQDVPVHGGRLYPVFAQWDHPAKYLSFKSDYEFAILMKFWKFVPSKSHFEFTSGILVEWEKARNGGLKGRSMIVGIEGQADDELTKALVADSGGTKIDYEKMIEIPISDLPHEAEEAGNWDWTIPDLARRKGFDPFFYTPQWKTPEKPTRKKLNKELLFAIEIFSEDEIRTMDEETLQRVYDTLWERYLAQKMIADYLIHYYGDHQELPRPDCEEIYRVY